MLELNAPEGQIVSNLQHAVDKFEILKRFETVQLTDPCSLGYLVQTVMILTERFHSWLCFTFLFYADDAQTNL